MVEEMVVPGRYAFEMPETSIFCMYIYIYIFIPGPSSLGAKWFRYRVSITHPLGFNWHPLEGPGIYIYIRLHMLLCLSQQCLH